MASALAEHQFDNQVKRVRVFVPEELRERLADKIDSDDWANQLLIASASIENRTG